MNENWTVSSLNTDEISPKISSLEADASFDRSSLLHQQRTIVDTDQQALIRVSSWLDAATATHDAGGRSWSGHCRRTPYR